MKINISLFTRVVHSVLTGLKDPGAYSVWIVYLSLCLSVHNSIPVCE